MPLRTQSSTAASPAARLAAVTASLSATVVRVRLAAPGAAAGYGFAGPSGARVPSTGGRPELARADRGEASPSPVYGAALLMRFGSQAHRGFKSLRLRHRSHAGDRAPAPPATGLRRCRVPTTQACAS